MPDIGWLRQLELVPGATDEEGRLLVGLGPGALRLDLSVIGPPPFLGVKDGLLLWSAHYPPEKLWSAHHPPGQVPYRGPVGPVDKWVDTRGVLLQFARVKDVSSAERVASRYGPLGLCEHGYLRFWGSRWLFEVLAGRMPGPQPQEGWGWTCCPKPHVVPLPYGRWAVGEPLEAWLRHARWLRSVLEAIGRLGQGEMPPESTWQEAMYGPNRARLPHWMVKVLERPLGLSERVEVKLKVEPATVLWALQSWVSLNLVGPLVRLRLGLSPQGPAVTVRSCFADLTGGVEEAEGLFSEDDLDDIFFLAAWSGGEVLLQYANLAGLGIGFAPFLALQVYGALWGKDRAVEVALCDGCGQPYMPSRKPRADRRNFCQACRSSSLPARLRKRDQLARRRQQALG